MWYAKIDGLGIALSPERNRIMHPTNTKAMHRLNLFLIAATALGGIVFILLRGLETKIPASFCFLLLGILNTRYALSRTASGRGFVTFLMAGLFFGFGADIVLELHFLGGAGLFALGHICYIAAFFCLLSKKSGDCLCCACIVVPALALVLFLPVLDFGSDFMQGVVLIYALIISVMTGKAIANHRRSPSVLTKTLLIGSVLFFFSDFMLLFAFFTDIGRIANILCLLTYYPGQAILASSIYHYAELDGSK